MTSTPTRCISCGNPRHSVFIGGELLGVTYGVLENWFKDFTPIKFTHILKEQKRGFGHVHFHSEEDAGTFYYDISEGKRFTGPNGITIRFRAAVEYKYGHDRGIPVIYKRPGHNIEDQAPVQITENQSVSQIVENQPPGQPSSQNIEQDEQDAGQVGKQAAPHIVENRPPGQTPCQIDRKLGQILDDQLPSRIAEKQPLIEISENQAPYEQLSRSVGKVLPRKRRSEGGLVDHLRSSKTGVLYRIYDNSTSYTILVSTPGADEAGLVVTSGGCVVTLAWKIAFEVTGTLIESHIPAGLATDIEVPERVDEDPTVVKIERGLAMVTVKKLEHTRIGISDELLCDRF